MAVMEGSGAGFSWAHTVAENRRPVPGARIAALLQHRQPPCHALHERGIQWGTKMRKIPMAKKRMQLGRPTPIPASPDKAVLDRVPNPHAGTNYIARFTAPEFTTLCPITGQPDFAYLVIDYLPARYLVESKSLKLYFNSFRNYGAFHEDCTVAIGKKLATLLKPKWLRIGGYWYPRGGMPIDVFWQTGKLPMDVWVPDQGVAPYRGRG
jgi:7-cyano-7-deazaguanine reductase